MLLPSPPHSSSRPSQAGRSCGAWLGRGSGVPPSVSRWAPLLPGGCLSGVGHAEAPRCVLGLPSSALPLPLGRLRPSLTRIRRAGARGSSTPSGCRWRRTKGTTRLDWAETCHTHCTEALDSQGLPELCTPPLLSHSIFSLSPLAETAELSTIPIPSWLPPPGAGFGLSFVLAAALFLPCAGSPLLGSALSFEPMPGADKPLGISVANHDILAGMGMPGVPEPARPAGGELRHCAHAAWCTLLSILSPVLVAMETG